MKDKTNEFPLLDLDVYYKGKIAITLNHFLITKQKRTSDQVNDIKNLHKVRLAIEDNMNSPLHSDEALLKLYLHWTEVQYALQEAWGFKKDVNYHPSHLLSRCICPKMDNDERLGTPYRVVTEGCPLHRTGEN